MPYIFDMLAYLSLILTILYIVVFKECNLKNQLEIIFIPMMLIYVFIAAKFYIKSGFLVLLDIIFSCSDVLYCTYVGVRETYFSTAFERVVFTTEFGGEIKTHIRKMRYEIYADTKIKDEEISLISARYYKLEKNKPYYFLVGRNSKVILAVYSDKGILIE